MKTVSLEMNVEQAQVICSALDLYNRISLGQFEELESLIRHRLISKFGSYGIGNPNVHISNSRSYEMLKTIQKVLAEDRNPNPDFRTVDYDGVLVRYTQDQLPTCVIINETEENNDGC
jgi:hypothetical protein